MLINVNTDENNEDGPLLAMRDRWIVVLITLVSSIIECITNLHIDCS